MEEQRAQGFGGKRRGERRSRNVYDVQEKSSGLGRAELIVWGIHGMQGQVPHG